MLAVPDELIELCGKKRSCKGGAALNAEQLDKTEHLARAAKYLRSAKESVEGVGEDATAFAVSARVRDMGG